MKETKQLKKQLKNIVHELKGLKDDSLRKNELNACKKDVEKLIQYAENKTKKNKRSLDVESRVSSTLSKLDMKFRTADKVINQMESILDSYKRNINKIVNEDLGDI